MDILNSKIIVIATITSALLLSSIVHSEAVSLQKSDNGKDVKLHFNPSSLKPTCHKGNRHYLIVNKAGYYNSVFEMCSKDNKFTHFWGWDNREYTIFKPGMYSYWALLPEKI